MAGSDSDNIQSKRKLTVRALSRFIPGLSILALILFASAGTLDYWNGWLFLGELTIPMVFVFIYLIINDPELLLKRLNTREKEKKQKNIVLVNLITFLTGLILAGLDFRFNWSNVPIWLEIVSAIFLFLGYLLFFIVIRQNSYASRVIEIQEKQKVIDTGLYSIVRHPMYLAVIIMYLFLPLLLGSFFSFIIMLLFPFQINMRISNEEEVLEKGLAGYMEYKERVKYKVIPYIW